MTEDERSIAHKLALACNVLARNGHSNLTLGHVTVRAPGPERMFMNAHDLGLEEITADDVILLDFDGAQLAGRGRRHSEFPLHAEIYRMYPEINAVVHTHPFYCLAIGATQGTIIPLSHEGTLFAGIPLFDETTLLIRTPEQGRATAAKLNGRRAMLMRRHGATVVGTSVEEAAVLAVLLENAARLQTTASVAGAICDLGDEGAQRQAEQVFYPQNIQKFWEYLVRKL